MARISAVCFVAFLALTSPSSALRLGKDLQKSNRQQSSLLLKDTSAATTKVAGATTAVSASGEEMMPPSLAALKETAASAAESLKDSASLLSKEKLAAFVDTARGMSNHTLNGMSSIASKVDISSLASKVKANVANGLKDGISRVEQDLGLGQDDGPIGGITYWPHSTGKYCKVDNFVYEGQEIDCQKRCIQTIGCNYWTVFDSSLCQLSSTCEEEGIADDPSARTYAQVNKEEPTFSQYSLGTKCVSDGDFLLEGDNMDCEQQCRDREECFYYTVYDSGYCQLSRTCTKLTAEEASSAVTYQSPKAVGPNSVVPKSGTKMCSNGKLLPNLYLLGVQKAGTTSLAGDLVEGGAWNTRRPEQSKNSEHGALVSAAGTIVGDLMSDGVMKPQDLSEQTKQAIADDLIAGGVLGTPTAQHLDNRTKKSLAADLVKAGMLNNLRAKHMDNKTQTLLTRDLVQACFKNANLVQSLDSSSRQDLARDLVRASVHGDVFVNFATSKLGDTTKHMLADDFARAGLFKTPLIDRISLATKKSLMKDALGNMADNLADSSMAIVGDFFQGDKVNHMDNKTKQLLTDDLIAAGALTSNESVAHDLGGADLIFERLSPATDFNLAWDIVKAGLLTDNIADMLNDDTKQLVVNKLQSNGLLGGDILDHLGEPTKVILVGDFVHQATFLGIQRKGQSLENSTKLSITNNLLASGIMQRSATTWSRETKELIVKDIMDAGLQSYTTRYTKGFMDVTTKESHYFEHAVTDGYDYSLNLREGVPVNWAEARQEWKKKWLNKLVDCPQDDTQTVYADFTPANMRMVPLPNGTTAKGRQWGILGDAMFGVNHSVPSDLVMNLPQMMDEFYGQDKSKITFVVMLREPMARMQSVYYHAKNSRGSGPCTECKGASFGLAMNVTMMYALGKAKDTTVPMYRDWLWTSMYARQLEHWFQYFHPSQFYVIPTWVYSKGSNIQICKDLSARVKTDLDCMPFKKTVADLRNTHEHKTLEEDTKIGLRMRFYDLMNPENDRLVKVLADANKVGLSLATYEGKKGNEANIKEWLVQNW